MKRVSEASEAIVRIEVIVEPVEVEVPPLIVEDEARHVQVAVRVLPLLYKIPSRPLPLEYSWGCIVFGTLKVRQYLAPSIFIFWKWTLTLTEGVPAVILQISIPEFDGLKP